MILFSAEAILASSTSKSGIWIPLTDDEDFNSSTDSTNSTSLIHSIASVGNCEQVHTSVLNLIFQQANVAGLGNLSKWRSEICSRCWYAPDLWKSSLLRVEWIFGWRSGLASLILNWCLILILPAGDEWIGSDTWELHGFNSCGEGAEEEDAAGFAKKFPDVPCVSEMLGGPFLRLSIPRERLSIPPGSRRGGENTGWLATWNSPLHSDSASLKISRIIHTINFVLQFLYLGSEFKDSVLIFDQSSSRRCIECWNLEIASILPSHEKRVSPFYHQSLHESSLIDFLWIIIKPTRIHFIATSWRKNSMIGAVPGTSSRAIGLSGRSADPCVNGVM